MVLQAINLGHEVSGQRFFKNINLEILPGQIHILLGANGAGKSSLLRALSGEITAAEGEVLLDQQPLHHHSLEERARHLAVLPQRSTLDFPFLAREVIQMGRFSVLENRAASEAVTGQVIEALALEPLANRKYTGLSGGEQQRVQIARVVAQLWGAGAQAFYLLDEPDAPLDLAHQVSLFGLLKALAGKGAAVVLSTHDLNLAVRYADHITLLKSGEVLAAGAVSSVMTPENIQAAYGVAVAVRAGDQGRIFIDYPLD